ncbi:MAG: flagellar hook-length control protein FliK [Alphaproteobacteria bacterium]
MKLTQNIISLPGQAASGAAPAPRLAAPDADEKQALCDSTVSRSSRAIGDSPADFENVLQSVSENAAAMNSQEGTANSVTPTRIASSPLPIPVQDNVAPAAVKPKVRNNPELASPLSGAQQELLISAQTKPSLTDPGPAAAAEIVLDAHGAADLTGNAAMLAGADFPKAFLPETLAADLTASLASADRQAHPEETLLLSLSILHALHPGQSNSPDVTASADSASSADAPDTRDAINAQAAKAAQPVANFAAPGSFMQSTGEAGRRTIAGILTPDGKITTVTDAPPVPNLNAQSRPEVAKPSDISQIAVSGIIPVSPKASGSLAVPDNAVSVSPEDGAMPDTVLQSASAEMSNRPPVTPDVLTAPLPVVSATQLPIPAEAAITAPADFPDKVASQNTPENMSAQRGDNKASGQGGGAALISAPTAPASGPNATAPQPAPSGDQNLAQIMGLPPGNIPDITPQSSQPANQELVQGDIIITGPIDRQAAAGHGIPEAAARTIAHPNPASPPIREIAMHISQHADTGINRFQLRLDPPELGRVDVRMEISADGKLSAVIAVERPETLDLLQRDQRALERSLADAGLKTDGNSLSFSLKGGKHENQHSGSSGQGVDRAGHALTQDWDEPVAAMAMRFANRSVNIRI